MPVSRSSFVMVYYLNEEQRMYISMSCTLLERIVCSCSCFISSNIACNAKHIPDSDKKVNLLSD